MSGAAINRGLGRGAAWWRAAARAAMSDPARLLDLARAGAIDEAYRAMIAVGARRYLEAIAGGDVAGDADVRGRDAVCRVCPRRVVAQSPGGVSGWAYAWCGVPLTPLGPGESARAAVTAITREGRPVGGDWERVAWDGVVGPACGCLLELKARVATEACPEGRWGPVARSG